MTIPANLFAAEQDATNLLGFYATQIPDRRVRSVREFGAVIDGETDDLEAWQAAFEWAAGGPGRALYFPSGTSVASAYLIAPDGLHLFGDGPNNSIIKCTATPDPPQLGAPIWLGNFHGFAVANDLVERSTSGAVNEGDTQVTLSTAAQAAEFEVDKIYYIRTQAGASRLIGEDNFELPTDSSLVKVTGANASTGVVTFERPVGFTSASSPLLCRIPEETADAFGPIYFAQDVVIENMGFDGWCAVGSNSAAGYNCHYRSIGGDVKDIIRANSLAYCSVDGFYGIWREVMAEIKLGAHDTVVRNLRGTNPDVVAISHPWLVPIISLGENCRNIEILDFKVDAPNYNGYHVVGLQSGTNFTVRGVAQVPSLEANPVVLYSSNVKSLRNFSVELVVVHCSPAVIYTQDTIGDADQQPRDGRVRVTSYSLSEESNQFALAAYGGSGIEYSGQFAGSEGKGLIYWGADASGNMALDCLTPELAVIGPGSAANISLFGRTHSGSAAPTGGSHVHGDRVINNAPSPGGYFGWVCTSGGSPGTWKGFGTIQS